MPLSKVHNTLTSDHILLDGTDSTSANANSKVLLDASASNTDIGTIMSFESGASDGSNVVVNTNLNKIIPNVTDFTPDTGNFLTTGSAGAIVQVVQTTHSTTTSNSTTTQADTGLTATITPTSSSNKILIFANQNGLSKDSDQGLDLRLYRGTTVILNSILQNAGYDTTSNRLDFGTATGVFLDSPATTSATTYKTQFSRFSGTGSVTVQQGTSISTMTLMEVVA